MTEAVGVIRCVQYDLCEVEKVRADNASFQLYNFREGDDPVIKARALDSKIREQLDKVRVYAWVGTVEFEDFGQVIEETEEDFVVKCYNGTPKAGQLVYVV